MSPQAPSHFSEDASPCASASSFWPFGRALAKKRAMFKAYHIFPTLRTHHNINRKQITCVVVLCNDFCLSGTCAPRCTCHNWASVAAFPCCILSLFRPACGGHVSKKYTLTWSDPHDPRVGLQQESPSSWTCNTTWQRQTSAEHCRVVIPSKYFLTCSRIKRLGICNTHTVRYQMDNGL